MINIILGVYLKFPGDVDWTDVTGLVLESGREHTENAFGNDHHYKADVFSCTLQYHPLISEKFLSATENIQAKVILGDSPIITGFVAPTFAQTIHEIVDGLSIEILDNSRRIEVDIKESYY